MTTGSKVETSVSHPWELDNRGKGLIRNNGEVKSRLEDSSFRNCRWK